MQGLSFGPADLAARRRMKTTRVGGGHPQYLVRTDPDPAHPDAPRVTAQQDPWHYTLARMVDACTAHGIYPYYGPFGDIDDPLACEDQFRAAFLLGCVGAWSLHPSQIEIAQAGVQPARRRGALGAPRDLARWATAPACVMLDGKMQDDATVKQCHVMVELAKRLAKNDARAARGVRLQREGSRGDLIRSPLQRVAPRTAWRSAARAGVRVESKPPIEAAHYQNRDQGLPPLRCLLL